MRTDYEVHARSQSRRKPHLRVDVRWACTDPVSPTLSKRRGGRWCLETNSIGALVAGSLPQTNLISRQGRDCTSTEGLHVNGGDSMKDSVKKGKKLTLSKETLRTLDERDLSLVVGGD